MPILRNSEQGKRKDLHAFYEELANSNEETTQTIGKNMLAFIEIINETFEETQLWGLTSLYQLVLQANDKWSSEWFIIVKCGWNNEYHFEYLMPEDKRPLENASVSRVAQNLAEAKKYLLIAMKETGGWANNAELQKRLFENNL